MSHTPTPWKEWDRTEHDGGVLVTDASGKIGICRVIQRPVGQDRDDGLCRDNAEFIIKACNSHDALVAACKAFVKYDSEIDASDLDVMLNYGEARDLIVAALALAEVSP